MAIELYIYSTDNTNPLQAGNRVKLDDAPWVEGIDTYGDTYGRGSVHKTIGGVVVQDFGVLDADRTISFSGVDALKQATVDALLTMYRSIGAEWHFTDGVDVFKVKFSRNPPGFRAWRNLKYTHVAYPFYSYEINLIVLDQVV